MLGINVTKADVDRQAGEAFLLLRQALDRLAMVKDWADTKTTADLEALGYLPGEAAVLKSAVADAGQLDDIFHGAAALAAAKDFRTFMKQVWGLGIVR